MSKLVDNNRIKELLTMIKNSFVLKETGKGLSTNDYTTAEKSKLSAFGNASTYALKTDIVKYSMSLTDNKLSLTGSDGSNNTVTLPTSGGSSGISVTDDGEGNVTILY